MPNRRPIAMRIVGALFLFALLALTAIACLAPGKESLPVLASAEASDTREGTTGPRPALSPEAHEVFPQEMDLGDTCSRDCATQPPSNRMHLADLRGEIHTDPEGSYTLEAYVTVHDQNHQPLGEVKVDASIWWPNGGPVHRSRMTRQANGTARFPWGSNVAGTWRLCVDALTKDGYLYDADAGETSICAEWNN
jgi:hypothetical protein